MVKNGNEEGVCRDFLRNVCRRGQKCKFRHPENGEEKAVGDMQFCHDYQNKMCTRSNCKFIHCSKEDEEYYHQTGDLPPGIEEAAAAKKGEMDDGEIPVCRDYQKGECKRGSSCKYRHMSRGDVEFEDRMRVRRPARPPPPSHDRYGDQYEHERYRRWLEHSRYEDFDRMDRDRFYREREPRDPHGYDRPGRDARDLEEENAILRRKNEDLRKTVADLTSTNDVLLEQNARLRALRAEANSAVLQAETHLVNSTASAGALSQDMTMAM